MIKTYEKELFKSKIQIYLRQYKQSVSTSRTPQKDRSRFEAGEVDFV